MSPTKSKEGLEPKHQRDPNYHTSGTYASEEYYHDEYGYQEDHDAFHNERQLRSKTSAAMLATGLLLVLFLVGAFEYLTLARPAGVGGEFERSDNAKAASGNDVSLSRYNSTVLKLRANPPPLSSLLNESSPEGTEDGIVGNIEWLLDFAIVGFPKSGTSSLKRWLNTSSTMYLDDYEVNGLSNHKPNRVVTHLYQLISSQSSKTKIGIKNPTDLESSMHYYHTYFPNTQLIVLLRHPVYWFQSYYNFRARKYNRLNNENNTTRTMPPLQRLIGKCHTINDGVCTDRAQYHQAISQLGLTPMNATRELNLLNRDVRDAALLQKTKTNQRVLFLEMNQMTDGNTILQHDLKRFLGVDDLPPMPPHSKETASIPPQNDAATDAAKEIDICHANYTKLRNILVGHGQVASQWILEYLLSSNNNNDHRVVVSSRHQFIHHVKAWQIDPCTLEHRD